MEENITRKVSDLDSIQFEFKVASCDEHELCVGDDYIAQYDADSPPVARFRSTCSGTLVFESGCGIRIEAPWFAESEVGSFAKAFSFTFCPWQTYLDQNLHGAILVDEDGIELNEVEASACIEKVLQDNSWQTHVEKVLPVPPVTLLDGNGDETDRQQLPKNGTSEFSRSRHFKPSVRFVGKLIASVESSPHQEATDFSGCKHSWTVLELFALESTARVCVKRVCNKWSNIEDISTLIVAKSDDEVRTFFGDDWLAKSLYKEAGIKRQKK